jgi:hypothetical protein
MLILLDDHPAMEIFCDGNLVYVFVAPQYVYTYVIIHEKTVLQESIPQND